MKLFKFILIILVFISCSENENRINLPQSDFTNCSIKNYPNDYLIFVDQVSINKFRIIDYDTLTTKLDSSLHHKIYDLQFKIRLHEQPKVVLTLDKNLPFTTFQNLTKEFRKIFKQSFILDLKGEKDLKVKLPPYIQNDSEYIAEKLRGKGASNYYLELEPYIKQKKVIILKVGPNQLKLSDLNSNEILDLKKYVELNKKFILLYEFSPESKYQDYVRMISFLKSTISEIKDYEKTKNHLTDEEIQEKYLFIIEEKNVLQQRV